MAAADRFVTVAAAKNVIKNRLLWPRCRNVVKQADAVFPCSSAEARLISRFYRVPIGSHWTVAPTGVHVRDWPAVERIPRPQRADALGLPSDAALLVVCVGRLEARKNQRALIRAVASLPGAALALLGGKDKQPYADDAVALGTKLLGDRFRWFGEVDRDEIRRALGAADVFALCSVREMASLAVHEAAATGCEVVTTRSGPTTEYYGDLAHLCSPSVRGIRAAVERAATHPRQPLLRQRVVDAFDWSTSATAIAAGYGQLDSSTARR
jgi:glycosyltransferase involved in cell wall biosynthesis